MLKLAALLLLVISSSPAQWRSVLVGDTSVFGGVREVRSRCDYRDHTISGNFPRDLLGPVDTRANTWGNADYAVLPITFKPPQGCRVHVTAIKGDLVAWPKTGGLSVTDSRYAGILGGFSTTAPEGSVQCDYCADNTPLYVQGVVDRHGARVPFDYTTDTYLERDHILIAKIASWLNDTGFPIHIEITYTIVFRYEDPEAGIHF